MYSLSVCVCVGHASCHTVGHTIGIQMTHRFCYACMVIWHDLLPRLSLIKKHTSGS